MQANSQSLKFSNLHDWLNWQESLHFTAIELGLDRCNKVAARMGLLSPKSKVISISGTNGKGSSAAMLDLALRRSGYQVGAYTSPHLTCYNERICINGKQATDAMLCQSFNRIDQARGDISLTYFEFGTLAALDIFQRAGLDIIILEVGLGGRLDAVNILAADLAMVVTVDLDHEKWLGSTRERIGREKAGIFRQGRPAVCSDPVAPASISECAGRVGARLYQAGQDFTFDARAQTWSWRCADRSYEDLPKPSLNNNYQVQNAAGALMALTLLAAEFPVDEQVIRSCLRDFRLAGRFQIVPGETPCILDVAHNQQAAAALVENARNVPCAGSTHLVIGMLKDKNHSEVFRRLAQIADCWYLVDLGAERAAPLTALHAALVEYAQPGSIKQFGSIRHALASARAATGPGDRIIVTGSFVAVGAAIAGMRGC